MYLPRFDHLHCSIFSSLLSAFIVGTAFTWSSPMVPKLMFRDDSPLGHKLTTSEITWISSLIGVGAVIGPYPVAFIAEKFGKKISIICTEAQFLVSFLIITCGTVVELYYFARLLMGLSIGGTLAVLPIYIGEMADKKHRGCLASMMGVFISAGIFFSFCIGPYTSELIFNLILAMNSAISLVLFLLIGGETPHYFVKNKDTGTARCVLKKIRYTFDEVCIDEELKMIERDVDLSGNNGTIKEIFKSRGMTKALFICSGLLFFQQTSGINILLNYGELIFEEAGAILPPEICVMIIGFFQFVSSFLIPFIVDIVGRKTTLIASGIGIIVANCTLGVYFYLKKAGVDISKLTFVPILILVLFIFTYSTGVGPLPWVMLGEMFPSKAKNIASSLVSSINWLVFFFMTKYLDIFMNVLGLALSYCLLAGISLIGVLFYKFYVIETKGKSLEEIQVILNKK